MALTVGWTPSVPEPAPKDEGAEVTLAVVEWLHAHRFPGVVPLVMARDAFGRSLYGQPLRTGDGRDTLARLVGDRLLFAPGAWAWRALHAELVPR